MTNNPLKLEIGDRVRPKVMPELPEAQVVRFKMDGTPIVRWNTNPDQDVLLNCPDEVVKVNE